MEEEQEVGQDEGRKALITKLVSHLRSLEYSQEKINRTTNIFDC